MSKKVRIRCKRGWIAYPGSPVQQGYGEAPTHGYLLWDISSSDDFNVKFCELPNPHPYVTLEWAGSAQSTIDRAIRDHVPGSRFRIRSKDVLSQKDVSLLMQGLQELLKATEVTFKNDQQINRDVLQAGAATLAKDDLRNPDVLLKLLKDYHSNNNVTDAEWSAVRDQIGTYLHNVTGNDDIVRNTKWSLRHIAFDNMFAYGQGNVIDFNQLSGIVGIFGPNRVGKSSIVGTLMYSLFNTTDRGSIKNLHVINVRHDHCYTKAIISVNGAGYVIERQTVKHSNYRGQFNANTSLNVFKIDDAGEAIDMAGEERKDTEKVIRGLIGSGDDCLLTSVAAQDEIKQYINHGSTRRKQILSRFLDLDIFDRMYEQARDDVNSIKAGLRNLPDRDWQEQELAHAKRLADCRTSLTEKDRLLHDTVLKEHDLRHQLSSFKDFVPVTQMQVEAQRSQVNSLVIRIGDIEAKIGALMADVERMTKKVESIDSTLAEHDIIELKQRQESYRTLEASFEAMKHVLAKEDATLKQQQRSLKILDEVPCGDEYPTCRFIKDAHKNKEKVGHQQEKVDRAQEKVQKAELTLADLLKEDIHNKVTKIEQLMSHRSTLQVSLSTKQVELVKLEATRAECSAILGPAMQRLQELEEALKNEENADIVTLRRQIDDLQRLARRLDAEKLALASEAGHAQSDFDKLCADRDRRADVLQQMKTHELIAQAFSRRGIPALITTSQLPVINTEVAKILHGIVDFNIELEVDDNDSMEVYINYGDSRRPIELGSGMEKTIASIAIRVALVNVSSLPKSDMFIIDEGFGALDDAMVEACNRLLTSLKRYFRTIIVITHVEGVKDVADHILEITKVEKDSHVVYSDLWPSDPTSVTA